MLVKAWLLFALSRVASENDWDAATRALSGSDPLIRFLTERRLIRERRRAEQITGSDHPAHLARAASFRIVGNEFSANFDDEEGLRIEYESAFSAVAAPAQGPRITVPLLGVALALAAASVFSYYHFRGFEPSQTPAGALFEREFTTLAVGAANGNEAQIAASLRAFDAEKSVRVVPELRALARAAIQVRKTPDDQNSYRAEEVDLNQALAKAGLPYYIDADLFPIGGTLSPVLMSFYVEQSGVYQVQNKAISVLRLWRLDHMNVVQSKLGYTRPASPYAIVLLDHLEHDLVTQLLPAVPEGEIMSLTDEDTSLSALEWVAEVQTKGGELIRKHYAQAPAEITEKARRVGRLLARRRALLKEWDKSLASSTSSLRLPRRLIPEGDYSADLHLRVPTAQLIEWDDLHDELLSSSMLRDFEDVREAYARSVERHEVQHRLDYGQERFSLPEMLAYRMGGISTMGHSVYSHPMRASAELSAYLAQVADDPAPRLAVLTMSRAVLNQYSSRTSHGYAAAVALEALAEHLGLSTKAAVGRVATRQELAQLMLFILNRPMAEVQKAARSAYSELFGEELPQVKRGKFTVRDVWRH